MPRRYCSPRRRAQRTLELLDLGCHDRLPWTSDQDAKGLSHPKEDIISKAKVQITQDVREWDYGDYEGLTSKTIRENRSNSGEGSWDIWRDGCPGGEYVSYSSMMIIERTALEEI